jgi:N-acetylglucosamine-6-phosphate deacetylase
VDDEAQQMCYNVLNRDRLILVSDAVVSAGLKPGTYESYGRAIISNERGVRYKKDDVLMGSNMLINDILKRFLNLTNAPLYEGMRFASYNACHLLGISDKKGSIEVGKEADLLLLDNDYNVVMNLG